MKYILLAILSLSMIGTPINGQKPFFSERTKMVAGGAFMSSLMSVVPFVIGGIIYQECAGSRKGPFKLEFTIDSMPKIKALAATLVGGAIIGGYLTYKTEKEFEANKFQHLMNAQERFAAYKNNKSIKNAFAASDVTQVEEWLEKADRKSSYNFEFPIVSAFDFLREWRDELRDVHALNKKLTQYFEGSELARIEIELESISDYVAQLNTLLVILMPAYRPTILYQSYQPIYARPTTPLTYTTKTPIVSSVPAHAPSQPNTACKISPVLNGNVYGTIWSNY